MPALGANVWVWAILLFCLEALSHGTSDGETINAATVSTTVPTTTTTARTADILSEHASSSVVYPTTTITVTSSRLRAEPNTVPPAASTCHARTINYITHTLPQQCLRTSWVGSSTSTAYYGETATAGQEVSVEVPWAPGYSPEAEAQATESVDGASVVEGSAATEEHSRQSSSVKPAQNTAVAAATTAEPDEPEGDSPLDNANFLSFEDWKKQNLAKAGQNPDNVGHGRHSNVPGERRRPVNINALDSLGDEAEIDLDFAGFGAGSNMEEGTATWQEAQRAQATAPKSGASAGVASRARSKDAGKTCKERFNYASFDCAATILKTNPQCKSSSAVLVENKDSYMLNECAAPNKFLIVELCDDIQVDTIVLANFEFFSSMFRTFRVSVSDRYPVKLDKWLELGTFEARNTREIQAFLVENPLIWARYLRIEFLTHYGNEFYCPVSLLRVHGTTMMEDFRHEEQAARGDDDFAEPIEEVEVEAQAPVKTVEAPEVVEKRDSDVRSEIIPRTEEKASVVMEEDAASSDQPVRSETPISGAAEHQQEGAETQAAVEHIPEGQRDKIDSVQGDSGNTADQISKASAETVTQESTAASGQKTETPWNASSSSSTSLQGEATNSATKVSTSTQSSSSPKVDATATQNGTSTQAAATAKSQLVVEQPQNKPAVSNTQPPPANPTTQESFFKSIHKRLQQLESNSTLSLQYIEEQSRILRDAFIKVEKRQLNKTSSFLQQLNETVMAELKSYRQQYDQLWQSTVIELENHREQHQREILAVSTRLSIVADELVWQKRMAVVQSTLLLLCIGLVLFAKPNAPLDVPLVEQVLSRSRSALRLPFESPPGSPSPTTGPSDDERHRHLHQQQLVTRRRGYHRRGTSSGLDGEEELLSDRDADGHEADTERTPARRGPRVEFQPPTPTSVGSPPGPDDPCSPPREGYRQVDGSPDTDGFRALAPSPEPLAEALVREAQSGPSTPKGTRDVRPSWEDQQQPQQEDAEGEDGLMMNGNTAPGMMETLEGIAEERKEDEEEDEAVDEDGEEGSYDDEESPGDEEVDG